MEERDDTDNAGEDTFRSCGMNQESMGCPAVSQVKKYSDAPTEEGIDEDMLDNSILSQEADEKALISTQKHHFQTHNQRPKSPDQQKYETKEQGEESLSVLEDSMSVDFPRTESNNEIRPPIEVLIKVEDNSHAARDSFSAGSSKSEQRLPLEEGIDGHILSNSSLSQEVYEKPFVMKEMSGCPKKCLKIYAEKKPNKCPVCEKFFSNRPAMRKHMQRHTGLKPYKCLVCEKGFYTPSELSCHMPSHTGEKPYRCSLCNSAFSGRSSLRVHTRTHTGEKPFKCQLCMATFSQTGHLRTHIMTHTGEKPYKCSHCDAAFTTGMSLKTHLRTHTGEKPHKCSYCVATFARPEHLRNHINTHTGEMPYKCQECNTAFNRLSNLKRHVRTHTGEKPYKCPYCVAAFVNSQQLKYHINTHTGERPFKCQECNSAYFYPAGLRRHMKIHTRNKSHECSYCTATFNSSSHLESHLKNHADKMSHDTDDTSPGENLESDLLMHKGRKRHECTLCNAVFTRPFALKRHLQTHNQRTRNTDQQKNEIEEIKEEILAVPEDFVSVDLPNAESNNEPKPPIEVFIKVEDDAHAAHNSFSAGDSTSEQRLPVEKVEHTHVASTDFISSCEVPNAQDSKVKVKEEKKKMEDQKWTHSVISSL